MGDYLGLIEMVLVFGLVIGLALVDYWKTKRDARRAGD